MTKIISLSKLYDLRSTIYDLSTIVLATGVFDLLHSEHKKFLTAAKKSGDVLLVGLESGARVRQLKGSTRPLNPISIRLRHLAHLNLADYVFKLPQNLDTQKGREDFIQKLHPHVLAVSSHTPNLAEKNRIMHLVSGCVKIVHQHNPSISTTKLLAS